MQGGILIFWLNIWKNKINAIYLQHNSGGLAQLARATALHAVGQRFDSVILHKKSGLKIGRFYFSLFSAPSNSTRRALGVTL